MSEQNQPLDNSFASIWAQRIADLLHERGLTQLQLAQMSGVSRPSISEWLNNRNPREPKITGFKAVADALGVSTDYLLGADECKTPTSEQIHKTTGLSDKAIEELIKLQHSIETKEKGALEKLTVCNFLLERINTTGLFEYLYNYLLGELLFENGDMELGATAIYLKSADGKTAESLTFAEVYSRAYFARVIEEISVIKDTADKTRYEKQKADYKAWRKTDEGKAAERKEFEEMMEMLKEEGKI